MTPIEITCFSGWFMAIVSAYFLIINGRALVRANRRADAWEAEARRFLDYGPKK